MPANHVLLASGAVVAVSAVVAAAIAIYESPELRRYTDDVRRRIAVALQALGDNIQPPVREPLFNRPEDADGFLQSRRGPGAEPGVDADDATRRSQREELMYWNSVRLQRQLEQELAKHADTEAAAPAPAAIEGRPPAGPRGTSFDDFLKPATHGGESGAYVVSSGAQTTAHEHGTGQQQLRHRGEGAGTRGFSAAAVYSNPFSDEHHIDPEEFANMGLGTGRLVPESPSDIYSATTREEDRQTTTTTTTATMEAETPSLIDFGTTETVPDADVPEEAYASIQAWARDSGLYSPLPVTPGAPVSEAEILSDGELTPTDSVSVVDVADEAHSSHAGDASRPYDVLSETDGMLTPASWSEVGSQVSESEHPHAQHA
ncbi:hypothetical protein ISF_08588 [Cordyceps fumosorosea ARSEF 2679]|uniref:Uncharacterized protein n=1 Tax=Cordyceps fumosorosea (strain ARSEF 2679) TaxID=1081104 RepID=A0A167M3R9_CORFA|nr:hypothetical protein ISF_08588 [Cordyceps fumosorosea ARSEF 2679]OAA53886.1 hypothetical protein ISF_08588 [Cordyceps fumosorosea ARSEF 2679]